ncbi:hypothetical protein EMCRGX_G024197 [Ephydatia muelleri]
MCSKILSRPLELQCGALVCAKCLQEWIATPAQATLIDTLASEVKCLRVIIKRRDLSNERNTFKSKTIFYHKKTTRARYKADPEKKKASLRDSYKADPKKKKASVRDSYKVDPEKKKASVRDSYKADPEKKKASVRDSYNADIESKQSAKRQRYQEDLEESRAA